MACLLKLKKFLHRAFPIVLTVYCVCGFSLYTVAYLYDAARPVTSPARSHQSDLGIGDDIIIHGAGGEFVSLSYSTLEYSEDFNPSFIFTVSSGSTYTVTCDAKLLPGGLYVVEEGAELIVEGANIYFYCADDYLDVFNCVGWTSVYDAVVLNYGTITCTKGGAIYSTDPEWSNIYGYDGDESVEDSYIREYCIDNLNATSVPVYGYARTSSTGDDSGSGSTDSGDGDTDSGDTSEDGDSDDSGTTGDDTDMDITGDFSTFGSFMAATLSVFQTEFTLFGFTLSYWDVFLWSAIAGIIIIVVRRILDG